MNNLTVATFHLDKGEIHFRLLDEAPIQKGTFVHHAKNGNFKGIKFFRVVPGFMAQSGPIEGTAGGYMWDEVKEPRRSKNNNLHFYGVLSAANTGQPNTSMGGFFISFGRRGTQHLDDLHTVFGVVIDGWEVINMIEQDDVINDITINTYTLN
jgi:peptidyl-prolyl cis-trans isomerase B (cyclophilin B)